MTLVGAIGVQLREISKGRDPLPMEDPSFLGKAMLSGGGLTLLGDFLFSHINERGFTPQQFVAGPIGGLAADTTQLAFGDVFKWAEAMGSLGEKDFESTTAAKAVAFARKYTPGSTLWYARLALQRAVFDRLEQLADPRAAVQQRRRERRRAMRSGNESWWEPGDAAPERAPAYLRNTNHMSID